MSTISLLMMPMLANGFLSMAPSMYYDVFDWRMPLSLSTRSHDYEAQWSSNWVATKDNYVMKIRIPDLEPDSVTATLMADEAVLTLEGKRKFDGCECSKSVVGTVPLPYRPREEDVEIVLDNDKRLLELKLARQAKAPTPTPLKIKMAPSRVADEKLEGTRPIRFVPHASASAAVDAAPSIEDKEKTLTAKFAAALAPSSKVAKDETEKKMEGEMPGSGSTSTGSASTSDKA